jgi:hypothetical protein
VFGKLFNFKKVPKNEGNLEASDAPVMRVVKLFEIELTNMEGSPSYALTHQLTIGSEIGNIVIADSSISPRHATFLLQQEVVSLIDHASVNGTSVNGKKIASGKYIILEESDVINIGDLEIRIKTRKDSVPEDEIPEPPVDEVQENVPAEETLEESEPEEEMEDGDKTPVPSKLDKVFKAFKKKFSFKKKQKGKAKLEVGLAATYSANALVRVVAVAMDFLLSYSLVIILMPFDDFRNFVDYLPDQLGELLGVEWHSLWMTLTEDYGFIREVVSDVLGFLSGVVYLGPLVLVFFVIRFLTTLVFGVSISEYLLSMKGGGNGIWARIGGMIRVVLGMITGPFLIFDVPAIVSRRTFKEFMTFTNVQLRSKFIAILSTLLFVPGFIALILIAPLFEGFEPPQAILVTDRLERRLKVNKEGGEETQQLVQSSKFLHLELPYNPLDISVIPELKFQGSQKKLSFSAPLNFYHKELQRVVSLELLKTFDFSQLLGLAMKGNFFLYDKFPEIYGFVYQAEGGMPFKPATDARAHQAFANEFMSFSKMALELSVDNFLEVMETQTPLIKGLIDFKSGLLALLEYKNFDQIGFIKIGNVNFMKVTYQMQKPFDLLIPLVKGEGKIYKVEFDKRENLNQLSSKFYKYTLDKANWFSPQNLETTEVPNVFQVLDLIISLKESKKTISADNAQGLYAYFFEKSSEILNHQDVVEADIWKKSLNSMTKMVDSLKSLQDNTEGTEDSVMKLKQNFSDLKDAFENQNLEYFGQNSTQTI